MTALKVVLIILGAFVLFQAIFRIAKKLYPIPAPAFAGRFFDSNFRRRALRSGGILAVTELLPDPDYPWRSTTIKLCRREGFVLDASLGNIWNYTVRLRKE